MGMMIYIHSSLTEMKGVTELRDTQCFWQCLIYGKHLHWAFVTLCYAQLCLTLWDPRDCSLPGILPSKIWSLRRYIIFALFLSTIKHKMSSFLDLEGRCQIGRLSKSNFKKKWIMILFKLYVISKIERRKMIKKVFDESLKLHYPWLHHL